MSTPTGDAITEQWLSELLTGLGDGPDQIHTALRNAKITGQRGSRYDCPLARYVADHARKRVPSAQVRVRVYEGAVVVEIEESDTGGYREVGVEQPEAVKRFVQAFDGGYYLDLVDREAA
ncbi:hypothetical protein E1264_02705 [Actinomadura sp. KC216]|uniref:hypothetical protein n=1 Tax=unclassified Actinomadura TaxID=2626254 RepID=UPI00104311D7|nr:hypothetical protein [Actinomadura sp. KC216]TDB91218.1 hypothetical protein E1264_02705 [Actinomadura sp. KC216]